MTILITAPHARCITKNPETRHCDIMASDLAEALHRNLTERGASVILHQNKDVPRWVIDMNRRSSRRFEYRRKLAELMKCLCSNDVLLDVHSAPQDTYEHHFDVYFLDIHERPEDDLFVKGLHDVLIQHGFDSYIYYGSSKNDIIFNSIVSYGLKNVALIEINESINEKDLEKIAVIVSDYVFEKDRRRKT